METAHAELDAHGENSNVTMSTEVALNGVDSVSLSFDFQPRDGGANNGNEDTSDMKVIFDGKEIEILSDANGNVTFNVSDNSMNVNAC